jgi:hypothetical protein
MLNRRKELTMKTFSSNALAEMLERDRATVVRALRKVPADSVERKQPRWKLVTALAALDRLPGSHNAKSHRGNNNTGDGWVDPRIFNATEDFEKALEEVRAIPDLEKRRAFAIAKLRPMLTFNDQNLAKWSIENGNEPELAQFRAQEIWRLELIGARHACEWSYEEGYDALVASNDDDD